MTQTPVPPLTRDVAGLAGLFLTSGVTHLVKPEVFSKGICFFLNRCLRKNFVGFGNTLYRCCISFCNI